MRLFNQREFELLESFHTKLQSKFDKSFNVLIKSNPVPYFTQQFKEAKSQQDLESVILEYISCIILTCQNKPDWYQSFVELKDLFIKNNIEAVNLIFHTCSMILLKDNENNYRVEFIKLIQFFFIELIENINFQNFIYNLLRTLIIKEINEEEVNYFQSIVEMLKSFIDSMISKKFEMLLSLIFYKLIRILTITQINPKLERLEDCTFSLASYLFEKERKTCFILGKELFITLGVLNKNKKFHTLTKQFDADSLLNRNHLDLNYHISILRLNLSNFSEKFINFLTISGNKFSFQKQMMFLYKENEIKNPLGSLILIDLIRYILISNDDSQKDGIKNWQIIGFLFFSINDESHRMIAKRALFFEFAFPGNHKEDSFRYLRVVKIVFEVINGYIPKHPDVANELIEFMIEFVVEYEAANNFNLIINLIKTNFPDELETILNSSKLDESLIRQFNQFISQNNSIVAKMEIEEPLNEENIRNVTVPMSHSAIENNKEEYSSLTFNFKFHFSGPFQQKTYKQIQQTLESSLITYTAKYDPLNQAQDEFDLVMPISELHEEIFKSLTNNNPNYFNKKEKEYTFPLNNTHYLFSFIISKTNQTLNTNLNMFLSYQKFIENLISNSFDFYNEFFVFLFSLKDDTTQLKGYKDVFKRVLANVDKSLLNNYNEQHFKWIFCFIPSNSLLEFVLFSFDLINSLKLDNIKIGFLKNLLKVLTTSFKNHFFTIDSERLLKIFIIYLKEEVVINQQLNELELFNYISLIEDAFIFEINQEIQLSLKKLINNINKFKYNMNHSFSLIKLVKTALRLSEEVS